MWLLVFSVVMLFPLVYDCWFLPFTLPSLSAYNWRYNLHILPHLVSWSKDAMLNLLVLKLLTFYVLKCLKIAIYIYVCLVFLLFLDGYLNFFLGTLKCYGKNSIVLFLI